MLLKTDLSTPIDVALPDGRRYRIVFRTLDDLSVAMVEAGLRQGRCIVITDDDVGRLYAGRTLQALEAGGFKPARITVPAGEASKSLAALADVYGEALRWGVDRKTPVVALGGGVVGDLAGFAAATLLRGLPLVQVPTTLIAQVDSAIGGKTGINHDAGKNLIGAFHQPSLVLVDLATPRTLPEREWTSGLAEVVKHALIADPELLEFLESNWQAVLHREPDAIGPMIYRAAQIKVGVIVRDEREAGLRAILNFGHTFAHALERVAGYGAFTHGEAVALGLRAALYLSHRLNPDLPLERADALVRRIPIHRSTEGLQIDDLNVAMTADKKAVGGTLRFVVLDALGGASVTADVSPADVEAAWRFALGS
jgi:3-dehydroquinate synthase